MADLDGLAAKSAQNSANTTSYLSLRARALSTSPSLLPSPPISPSFSSSSRPAPPSRGNGPTRNNKTELTNMGRTKVYLRLLDSESEAGLGKAWRKVGARSSRNPQAEVTVRFQALQVLHGLLQGGKKARHQVGVRKVQPRALTCCSTYRRKHALPLQPPSAVAC